MKHPSSISTKSHNRPLGLAMGALDHLLTLMHERLTSSQSEPLFREVGRRLGRDVWRHYRAAFQVGHRPALKDMVQCIAGLEEAWEWPCTILQQSDNQITLSFPPLPLSGHAGVRHAHGENLAVVTSGVFGGISEEAFGYGKVCFLPTDLSGRTYTRVVLHVKPSSQSDAAPGFTYRKYVLDTASPDYRSRAAASELAHLSRRERQILQCVGEGLSNKEMAAELGISVRTVEGHVSRVCVKLNLRRRADLMRFSLRHKLASL